VTRNPLLLLLTAVSAAAVALVALVGLAVAVQAAEEDSACSRMRSLGVGAMLVLSLRRRRLLRAMLSKAVVVEVEEGRTICSGMCGVRWRVVEGC